jgi:hypothetical protein
MLADVELRGERACGGTGGPDHARTGVTHARLIIDNPNGICGRCVSQVPTLLPEGVTLEVTTPLGTAPKTRGRFNSRTFVGNGNDPKPWPPVAGRNPEAKMNVVWSATSPETRRVAAVMRTEFQELEARFIELRSIGEGYIEVELSTEGSPQVILGFRGDHAVVEQLSDLDEEPKSFLLVGDDSLPPDGKVEVPIMDDDVVFTGDFVMSVDRAWDAVRDFVRTGSCPFLIALFPAEIGDVTSIRQPACQAADLRCVRARSQRVNLTKRESLPSALSCR